MPASTREVGAAGTEVSSGKVVSVITANETNQLKTGKGRLVAIAGFAPGGNWVADVYDATAGTTQPIWQWVTADGKGQMRLDIPFGTGLRVITSGTTPGSLLVVWS